MSSKNNPGQEVLIQGRDLAARGYRFNKGWYFHEAKRPRFLILGCIPFGHEDVVVEVYEPVTNHHPVDPNTTMYRKQTSRLEEA